MVPDGQLGEVKFGSSVSSVIADVYHPNTGGVGAETGVHQELIGWPTSLDSLLSSQESPLHGLRLGCGGSHTPSHCLPLLDLVWAFSTSAGDKTSTGWEPGQVDVGISGCGHTLADCHARDSSSSILLRSVCRERAWDSTNLKIQTWLLEALLVLPRSTHGEEV